jgi:hypothetical protein
LFCIICGVILGFKVYVGIFALSGLIALLIYFLIKRKFANLVPIFIAFIVSLIIYLPVNSGAGGLYFTGMWRVEDYVQIAEYHLGLSILALDIYKQHKNLLRIIEYDSFFFLLYVISSFGLKIFGLVQNKKTISIAPWELHVFLGGGIITSFILGVFFSRIRWG